MGAAASASCGCWCSPPGHPTPCVWRAPEAGTAPEDPEAVHAHRLTLRGPAAGWAWPLGALSWAHLSGCWPPTGCSSRGPGQGWGGWGRRCAVQPTGEHRARKTSAPWRPRVTCHTHASGPQGRSFSLFFSCRSDKRAFDHWVPHKVSGCGFSDNAAPLRGSNGDRLVKLTSASISKSFFKLF